jgi:hypothetical protein
VHVWAAVRGRVSHSQIVADHPALTALFVVIAALYAPYLPLLLIMLFKGAPLWWLLAMPALGPLQILSGGLLESASSVVVGFLCCSFLALLIAPLTYLSSVRSRRRGVALCTVSFSVFGAITLFVLLRPSPISHPF